MKMATTSSNSFVEYWEDETDESDPRRACVWKKEPRSHPSVRVPGRSWSTAGAAQLRVSIRGERAESASHKTAARRRRHPSVTSRLLFDPTRLSPYCRDTLNQRPSLINNTQGRKERTNAASHRRLVS